MVIKGHSSLRMTYCDSAIGKAISEKMFKDYTILYIARAQGQITPGGQKFECS